MNYSYDSNLVWEKGAKTEHNMKLKLQMDLDDFLTADGNVAQKLLRNEQSIRREIFEVVRTKVVPGIIHDTPMDSALPSGKVTTDFTSETHARHSIGHPRNSMDSVAYNGMIDVDFSAIANRPLNAMQMLRLNTESIAHDVTNVILNGLRHRYLGEKHHQTTHSSATKNGSLIDYDAKIN